MMKGVLLLSTIDYVKTKYNHTIASEITNAVRTDTVQDGTYENGFLEMIFKVKDPNFYENIGSHLIKYLLNSSKGTTLLTRWSGYKEFLYGLERFEVYIGKYFPCKWTPQFTILKENNGEIYFECWSEDKIILQFLIGFIREVGNSFYKEVVSLTIIETESNPSGIRAVLKLAFSFVVQSEPICFNKYVFPFDSKLLEQIFPYSIVVSSRMKIISLGVSLLWILPESKGRDFSEVVILNRPDIPIHQAFIMKYSGKTFDLLMKCLPVSKVQCEGFLSRKSLYSSETFDGIHYVRLKGKIIFIEKWNMFIFLGTPVLTSLASLYSAGINICHLSIHDFSRDFMLAEAQQTVELKMQFDQGIEKQKKLECFLHKLHDEMERTNIILNEMVPEKTVLEFQHDVSIGIKLIENVTVLISDIVRFTCVCSFMKPMEVVTTLNEMYSKFDKVTAKHGAHKVETIGDAYMIVSALSGKGLPQKVCDVALDMRHAIQHIKNSKTGTHLKIRIGIHTGPVVAGIIGLKVPKFCLFGSTVKVAVLLEASSSPMKIKISQSTKEALQDRYNFSPSEPLCINEKDVIKTFWLSGKRSGFNIE